MSTPNNEPDPNEVGKHVPSTIVDILSERGYTMLGRIGKGSYANVYVCRYQPPNDHDKRVYLACKMIDTKKVPKHFTKRFLPREIDVMRKVKKNGKKRATLEPSYSDEALDKLK